jgi:hypothetical protein
VFDRDELDGMLDLAMKGITELTTRQETALGAPDAD